jgi:cis-2,3-dihydrobiphenyl-2,3-diol dehydrogenase
MSRLEGQVALVTGGASGLGKAIVERFIKEGARVGVLDRSKERLAALTGAFGESVCTTEGDVRSLTANKDAVQRCVTRFGRLDCAIGNAGIWDYNSSAIGLPEESVDRAFDELFQINVKGYLLLAKAAAKPLAETRGGVIYTVSNAGFYPGGGGPLYTAAKHAVVGLIRQLAYEFAPFIRVNGVAPGGIQTDLRGPEALGLSQAQFPGAMIAEMAKGRIPVGRLPTPDEYVGAYVFFATRQDNFPATGTVLNFDGGLGVMGLGGQRPGDQLPQQLGLNLKEHEE